MKIPFLDLRAAYEELQPEIDEAVGRALASGWYIGGPEVERFEADYAAYCGAACCVGVANGLDALTLALRALGIGPGDEVILASNSYIATVLAVTAVGARPVFVEPDERTFNLDPEAVERALTPRTRALLPTHFYGQPANLEPLLAIARRQGLRLLEDAAQGHGSRHRGRRIGAHGDVVCWSFYPSKNLGAVGDAGAITTDDPALAERVRTLGNYGSAERYVNVVRGVNSRLDPVQAAVLGVKLRHLDRWNDRRRTIAERYTRAFAALPIATPHVPDWAEPAWHLYVVRHPRRDRLQQTLAGRGVSTLIHYPIPPHLQQAYADLGHRPGDFPIAERLANEVLSLPIGPQMREQEVDAVIEVVVASV